MYSFYLKYPLYIIKWSHLPFPNSTSIIYSYIKEEKLEGLLTVQDFKLQ